MKRSSPCGSRIHPQEPSWRVASDLRGSEHVIERTPEQAVARGDTEIQTFRCADPHTSNDRYPY